LFRRLAFGLFDPAAQQIRVELMMQRDRGNRHARRLVCRNHLRLEFAAVTAAATSRLRLFCDSVHVSHLDLCLHLVRRDFGPAIANQVARRLVIPPHRDGGQA
jgi:hypothetical protein